MPFQIRRNQENLEPNKVESQDLSSLIPLLQNPLGLLSQIIYGDEDKKVLKDLWLNSSTNEDSLLVLSSNTDNSKIKSLKTRGLLEIASQEPYVVKLTREGKKLLNQTILSDEKTSVSFTKKASKDLVSKNSYDFGEEVLVKLNHPERYSMKYVAIKKDQFNGKARPQTIDNYDISFKDEFGLYKELSSYSDEELVKVLHLAKRIIDNHHSIRVAGSKIVNVPIHRIKVFAQCILGELNRR